MAQLTPLTIVCLVGGLCGAILDSPLVAAIFMATALVNTLIMMWALTPDEDA